MNNIIPKSVVELTINAFKNDLEELEKVKGRIGFNFVRGYEEPSYMKSVRNNIEVYRLLINEYEKYLEENYSEINDVSLPGQIEIRYDTNWNCGFCRKHNLTTSECPNCR